MSSTSLAHGMGTELVEPDWPMIALDEVNELVRYYPQAGTVKSLLWHSPRPFSSATIAETSIGPLFIKRHHITIRDVEGLMEEHRFIAHLRSHGIAASEVLYGAAGQSAQAIGDWTYEIHRLAPGADLYRDALSWTPFFHSSHAYAAGQALAAMHRAAQSYAAPPRSARVLVSSFTIFGSNDPVAVMADYIAARPSLAAYVRNRDWEADVKEVLLPFHSRLLPWLDKLEPLWTHNDLHASNLLWSDAGHAQVKVESIIDLGLSDRTNAVYDLATAIERNMIAWLEMDARDDIVQFDHLAALLQGYDSVRPLSADESAALPAILPLVHAEFALSEADYFAGIVRSRANADLAYDQYLLGHARWFNGAPGQQLLRFLQEPHNLKKA